MGTAVQKQKKTTSIVLRDIEKINALDAISTDYEMALAKSENKFQMTFLTAEAMHQLQKSIDEKMMSSVMVLQNSRLGFKTDRDDGKGYPVTVVKNVMIEMTLRGLSMIGNQVNIIAGNGYITKEGFTYLLKEKVTGLTDLDIRYDVPEMKPNGAIVHCHATWRKDGIPQELDADIPIRVNKMMGADAVLGKAERKMKCRIYNRVTGSTLSDGDVDDIRGAQGGGFIDVTDTTQEHPEQAPAKPTSKTDDLVESLKSDKSGNKGEAEKAHKATVRPDPTQTPSESENAMPEPDTPMSEEDQDESQPSNPVDESGSDIDADADIREAEEHERAELCDWIDENSRYKGKTFKRYVEKHCEDTKRWREELSIDQLHDLRELTDPSK